MDRFFQQFTLIDFFGMFVPGAFLILMLHGDCGDFTQPVIGFFGDNAIILGLYFVFISYLAGFLCHELSKFFDRALFGKSSPYAAPLLNGSNAFSNELKQLVKELILIRYGITVGDDKEKITEMFGVIQLRVRARANFSKIQLMRSFYTFCRNFMAAILVVCAVKTVMMCMGLICAPLWEALCWALLAGGLLWLLWHRALRFKACAVRDTYYEFINMELEARAGAEKAGQKA